jgi:glycosyltransferase involved in cell wall biosynthesis
MKYNQAKSNIRLLYLVNVDWFFLSHRLPLALAAKEAGYDVWVACADTEQGEKIREAGLHFIPVPFSRSGTKLPAELRAMLSVFRVYRRIRPQLVHQVTIKPVLYGSIITRLFFRKMKVINAVTGLGFTFTEAKRKSLLSGMVRAMYRFALKNHNATTIFQNPDDLNTFTGAGLIKPGQATIIKGSGVDCKIFCPAGSATQPPVVLLASRMIWDKGIAEFATAADIIKQSGRQVRFVLAGKAEEGIPNAVPEKQLRDWQEEGLLEWLGHQSDMAGLIAQASIVTLPTLYPEGVPKVLIEAAACGKPIITTNRPGCREIVRHQINGLLIPPRNPQSLAKSIIFLLNNPLVASKYGQAGRQLVLDEFSIEKVITQTLALYPQPQ